METQFLVRTEAAAHISKLGLPMSGKTLGKFACEGGGPHYRKFGHRVVYTTSDLDEWVSSRLGPVLSSTAGDPQIKKHIPVAGKRGRGRPPKPAIKKRVRPHKATTASAT